MNGFAVVSLLVRAIAERWPVPLTVAALVGGVAVSRSFRATESSRLPIAPCARCASLLHPTPMHPDATDDEH